MGATALAVGRVSGLADKQMQGKRKATGRRLDAVLPPFSDIGRRLDTVRPCSAACQPPLIVSETIRMSTRPPATTR